MDYSQPRVTSANLSRAYATLKRLDVLRAQDVIHPVGTPPLPTRTDPALRANTDGTRHITAAVNATQLPHDKPCRSVNAPQDSCTSPAAAPLVRATAERQHPFSPTPNTSVMDEASRLTHPTTLASSSFLSMGTPLRDGDKTRPTTSSASPFAAAPAGRTSTPLTRALADEPRSERVLSPSVFTSGAVEAARRSSASHIASPSPHVDTEHRYRPRRSLAFPGETSLTVSSAPVTDRGRLGDYRGSEWEDTVVEEDVAMKAGKGAPRPSVSLASLHTAARSHQGWGPAVTTDTFIDQDPAMEVVLALTKGHRQPLSITRDSTERGDDDLSAAYTSRRPSQAYGSDARPAGTRSPFLSTQDQERPPLVGGRSSAVPVSVARHSQEHTQPLRPPRRVSQSSSSSSSHDHARRPTRPTADIASYVTSSSRDSSQASSSEDVGVEAVVSRLQTNPFAQRVRRPPPPISPQEASTHDSALMPTQTGSARSEGKRDDEAAGTAHLPVPQHIKRDVDSRSTSAHVASIAAAHAAQLVQSYRERQAHLHDHMRTSAPSSVPQLPTPTCITPSQRSSSGSVDMTLDPAETTHPGEPQEESSAPALPRSEAGHTSPSPRPAPSTSSYHDYLVRSPHPRSTTASHRRPDERGDDVDNPSRASPASPSSSDSAASAASADSPPRLTAPAAPTRFAQSTEQSAPPKQQRSLERAVTMRTDTNDGDDLLAYVDALCTADTAIVRDVLAAMSRDAAPTGADHDLRIFTEHCLGLTVLLNRPAIVEGLVAPLLAHELARVHAALCSPNSTPTRQQDVNVADDHDHDHDHDNDDSSRLHAQEARRRALLCALAGLGTRAAPAVWSTLLTLLADLTLASTAPPPDAAAGDTLALVLLAMRAVGGEEAVVYFGDCLDPRRPASTALRVAAAYGLGLMGADVEGHTSVLCLPLGHVERDGDNRAEAPPSLVLYTDATKEEENTRRATFAFGTATAHCASEEQVSAEASGASATAMPPAASPGLAPPPVQRPPPYVSTHVVLNVADALAQLQAFLQTHGNAIEAPDAPVGLGVVLRDLVSPQLRRVLMDTASASTVVLSAGGDGEASVGQELEQGQMALRSGLSEVLESIEAVSCEPVLPFSYTSYLLGRPALVFEVERGLLNAAVCDGASGGSWSGITGSAALPSKAGARLQETAVLALASLPSRARLHVAVPILEYAERLAATQPQLAGSDMPITVNAADSAQDNTEGERTLREGVFSALALALGCVATPEAIAPDVMRRAASLLCALVRRSPSARLRHGAMAGLGFLSAAWLRNDDDEETAGNPHHHHHTPLPAPARGAIDDAESPVKVFRRVVPVVLRLCTVCLIDGSVSAETAAWTCGCCQAAGTRQLLHLLRTAGQPVGRVTGAAERIIAKDGERAAPRLPHRAQLACVRALLATRFVCPSPLLDELIDTLGSLAISQGLVEEEVQRACVRVLAHAIHVASTAAPVPGVSCALTVSSSSPPPTAEVFEYYTEVVPNEPFKVLRSVLESSTVPYGVLCEIFWCLCVYGGAHGELYACQTCMESTITAARGAAAFGLRGAGARSVRVIVLALNDDDAEVREEAETTVSVIGVPSIVTLLLHHRPDEHRQQVAAALRDCLLRDLGRGRTHAVLEELYTALTR